MFHTKIINKLYQFIIYHIYIYDSRYRLLLLYLASIESYTLKMRLKTLYILTICRYRLLLCRLYIYMYHTYIYIWVLYEYIYIYMYYHLHRIWTIYRHYIYHSGHIKIFIAEAPQSEPLPGSRWVRLLGKAAGCCPSYTMLSINTITTTKLWIIIDYI